MRQLIFALTHYLALGLFALLAYIFGRRLTLRFRFNSLFEQVSFSTALGLGLIANLVFLLGLCRLLYPAVVSIVLLAGVLISHRSWSCWRGQLRVAVEGFNWRNQRVAVLRVAALCIFLIPLLMLPLYPPTAWDATEYHLASAKNYINEHAIVLTPYLRFPVFPQVNQMLFTLGLLLYDDVLAQLVAFLMMAVLVAAIVAFGQRFYSSRIGVWSAAILLESPLVIWSGSVAYVDMGLMLFTMMTVYAIWNYVEQREHHWIILAGIFCGLAAGTKYTGLFFLVVLGVFAVYSVLKRSRELAPLLAVALALSILAPWLARNFYYSRNPLFPFFADLFGGVFGYRLWTPEHYRGILEDFSHPGVGRSLKALIILPWNLTIHWRSFGARISGLPFVVPHVLFILSVASKRIGWLLGIGVGFTLFWFFTIQDPRYLLPALPLLSVAAAVALDALLLLSSFCRRVINWKAATVLGAILFLLPGWGWALLRIRERGPLPINTPQRDAYLTGQLRSYPAYKMLNEQRGHNYALYALYDERMAYFADGRFMGDHIGLARYSRVLDKIGDGARLYDELKRLGADYFLVRSDLASVDLPRDEFFTRRFKSIYDRDGIMLFELTQPDQ